MRQMRTIISPSEYNFSNDKTLSELKPNTRFPLHPTPPPPNPPKKEKKKLFPITEDFVIQMVSLPDK